MPNEVPTKYSCWLRQFGIEIQSGLLCPLFPPTELIQCGRRNAKHAGQLNCIDQYVVILRRLTSVLGSIVGCAHKDVSLAIYRPFHWESHKIGKAKKTLG